RLYWRQFYTLYTKINFNNMPADRKAKVLAKTMELSGRITPQETERVEGKIKNVLTAPNIQAKRTMTAQDPDTTKIQSLIDIETNEIRPESINIAAVIEAYIQTSGAQTPGTTPSTPSQCPSNTHPYNNECVSDACGGAEPSGLGIVKGLVGFTSGPAQSWTYDTTATTSTPCKWKCGAGYRQSGNGCVSSQPTRPPTTPTSLSISPTVAYIDSAITATASGSRDPDNSTVTYMYKFVRTGTPETELQPYSESNTFRCDRDKCPVKSIIKVYAKAVDESGTESRETNRRKIISNRLPTANAGGPYGGAVGTPIQISAAASSDLDEDALTYRWTGSSGCVASSKAEVATVTCRSAGNYNLYLTVTDSNRGTGGAQATLRVCRSGQSYDQATRSCVSGGV
ncbi:MAG: PKD domain-containing protein, partial [Candidatus Aenigmarchaeota archaeon]|nr:PKD domain-containing protein [Candidatus Aenigmarchaeota archaeon]